MRTMLKLKTLRGVLLLALVVLVAACSGDSPTAPNPGPGPGGGGGGGGTTPAVAVTVTTSNLTPLISSTSTITATVTINGATAPDGTAVEFTTTFGTFQETGTASVLRTTTGGVASATLTSSSAGPATVTVRVENVVRTAVVTFREQQSTTVVITGISPASGRASGGETLVIQGRNFEGPVRVLIDGKEAQVVSQTSTEIRVITPPSALTASQQSREVEVVVFTRAGTPDEQRVVAPTRFRYELEVLTPIVYSVSPASGPNEGNTRINIFGEGFQSPVRVYFGSTGEETGNLVNQLELEVIRVTFNEILAVTPPALGMGSPFLNQQVFMRVHNVRSNTDVVVPRAFRYGPTIQITAVGPTQGSALGGTTVTINGHGFDDPVAVTIGGIAAQPIRVSGTEIVAITGAPVLDGCENVEGPISVTNIEDGASAVAEGLNFTFIVPQPQIVSISPSSVPENTSFNVSLVNASGIARFTVGTRTILPGAGTTTDGVTTFTLTSPTGLDFETDECTTAAGLPGTRLVATEFDVRYVNDLGCEDVIEGGITVTPPAGSEVCVAPPDASAAIDNPAFTGTCGSAQSSSSNTVTVFNTGGSTLTVTGLSGTLSGFRRVGGATFPADVAPGASALFVVAVTPPATAPASPIPGTITVQSNDTTPPPAINVTSTCTP